MAAICARTESRRRCGEAGWLHKLQDDPRFDGRRSRRFEVPLRADNPERRSAIDFEAMARTACAAIDPSTLEGLARSLGVTAGSLERLSVGWCARSRAFTFPMRDAGGKVLGIRLRRPDGGKLAIRGGREGLFIPEGLSAGAVEF